MRRRTLVLLFAVIAVWACKAKAPEHPADGEITDEQITAFITWSREWGDLTRKHYDAAQEVSKRAAEKYSPDFSKISTDPDLLALLDRQRAEMQEHMDRCPIKGRQMEAMKAVTAAVLPKHDDQLLAQARSKYGSKVVDSILAHESDIKELTQHWQH